MKTAKIFKFVTNRRVQRKVQKEQGRSMVEMLGVLAIIGVLSIGGIAGYTMAMNRYKANQILDLASKLSIMAQTGAESNPDNWKVSVNALAEEEGYAVVSDYEGAAVVGGDFYETTELYVYENGQVVMPYHYWINYGGVKKALDSITGRDDGILVEGEK